MIAALDRQQPAEQALAAGAVGAMDAGGRLQAEDAAPEVRALQKSITVRPPASPAGNAKPGCGSGNAPAQ